MRAIIRVMIEDQKDEAVVKLKQEIEAVVKDIPKTEVELTILAR